MHALGEGFRKAVGESFHEDRAIVVVRLGEAFGDFVFPRAGRDREAADIIRFACLHRRNEIGKREIGTSVAPQQLLAQGEESREGFRA